MIAITGANGYIGRATLLWAAAHDEKVIGISRSKPNFSLPPSSSWRVVDGADLQPEVFLDCSCVIHLAGRAHTTIAIVGGEDLFDQSNRQFALNTAVAAHAAGVHRFVFVSSLSVHGNQSVELVRYDSPLCLDTPYARSKWSAEQALASYCASVGMELRIVRPPMVYGPNCPGNFSRLVKLVALGFPLPFGSMRSVRSFIQVDNLSSFLLICATRSVIEHNVFVIGDGSDWSTAELVRSITLALGKRPRTFPFPTALLSLAAASLDREREFASLSKSMRIDLLPAWQACKWQPPVSPSNGLIAAVRSYAI